VEWQGVANPRLSPDGAWVAYHVTDANWKDNEFQTQIWIAAANGTERYALTNSARSSTSPEWSPDGKRIAFLSDRGGKNQIYVISPRGGEAMALTNVETGVRAFRWAPDGQSIAFTALDPESKTLKKRKEDYGDFEVVDQDFTMTHLWVVSAPASFMERPAPQRVTEGTLFTVGGFSWAPDSRRLAFSAAKDPDLASSGTADVYVVSLGNRTVNTVVSTKGPDTNPVWSPDGRWIAFETANGDETGNFYKTTRIAVVPVSGGPIEVWTEKFDDVPRLVAWGPDGIYFETLQRTWSHVYLLQTGTRKISRVSGPDRSRTGSASFSKTFDRMAFLCGGANQFTEVCTSETARFQARELTRVADQAKGLELAKRELIEWKSKDGTKIEGVLLKPASFDASKKYPLLVVIHGGPRGVDTPVIAPDRYYPIEQFVAKGALVLRPNYRGSEGYGEKFRSLNVRNLGVGDYDDVISGVDHLIGKGWVDGARVGAMGWSQGGYISAFITCFSDRFKAVSVGAGISNWMTYYVNTDIHPFTRQYLKATPWDDPEIYRKTSPITYINKARTPTLIQHGEKDQRVPLPNAFELYQGLRDKNVPVKLVVYKGFGHGIDKPKQQLAVLEQNLEWFREWIWGEKPAAVSTGE
jgi:dipeptidyl aminopeptidase/acylaminoacyl peptidase